MKRSFMAAALFAIFAAPAAAASVTPITVTAEGRASAMPDMATAAFTVSTNSAGAASATSDNNARYERLLRALHGFGIADADIRTTSFSLTYNPPPSPPEVPQQGQRYGYAVYRSVSVIVRRIASVGKVVDAAVGSGVTEVNGVSFDTSDTRGQFALALADAVRQARSHAEAMAAPAGLRIVRVRQMQEGEPARIMPVVQPEVFRAAPAAVPTQIQPSAVETRATVTITYDAQ